MNKFYPVDADRLRGVTINPTPPSDGEVLIYDSASDTYIPGSGGGGGGTVWGQITGNMDDQADLSGQFNQFSDDFSAAIENITPLSGESAEIGGDALLAGTCASETVSIPGATDGMVVSVTPVTYPGDGVFWKAYVSAPDEVTIKVCVAINATPVSSVYRVRVIK